MNAIDALKLLVTDNGRGGNSIFSASAAHQNGEEDQLQNCEHCDDVDVVQFIPQLAN